MEQYATVLLQHRAGLLQVVHTHLQRCRSLTRNLRSPKLHRAAACLEDAYVLTCLVEKPMLLGQLCKLNPILSLEHNLPKMCSSAVSKSPGEIQGTSGTVENNIVPAGTDYLVA